MTETPQEVVVHDDQYAGYDDYWAVDETIKHFLPDGKQFMVIQPMNEGAKAKFQKLTSRSVVLQQKTGDAKLDVDPAAERHALIKSSVIDWHIIQRDKSGVASPAPFSPRTLESWLDKAPAVVVEKLEHAIRLANPWLQADMTLDAMLEERDRLEELIKQKREEEAGEGDSANR